MRKSTSGFTIVELLIVIVVIAILAAISIVAYNGIQARARDNIRYNDIKAIQKALELYKADKGYYPPTSATSVAGQGSTGCTANGYSYSWGVDGNWMKPLVDGGYLSKVPVPPANNCSSYYRYLKGEAISYGCTTRTAGWYMLQVTGADGASIPNESAYFRPCPESSAAWGVDSSTWTFAKDDI